MQKLHVSPEFGYTMSLFPVLFAMCASYVIVVVVTVVVDVLVVEVLVVEEVLLPNMHM